MAYRKAMEEYAPMGYLDLWHDRFTIEDLQTASHMSASEMAGRVKRFSSKARKRTGSVEVRRRRPRTRSSSAPGPVVASSPRQHAWPGDAASIAAYLGNEDAFDRPITDFSKAYAEQSLRDFTAFVGTIDDGRLPCAEPESQ
jgi:hypothetical protein